MQQYNKQLLKIKPPKICNSTQKLCVEMKYQQQQQKANCEVRKQQQAQHVSKKKITEKRKNP